MFGLSVAPETSLKLRTAPEKSPVSARKPAVGRVFFRFHPSTSYRCSCSQVFARIPYRCSWRQTEIGDLSTELIAMPLDASARSVAAPKGSPDRALQSALGLGAPRHGRAIGRSAGGGRARRPPLPLLLAPARLLVAARLRRATRGRAALPEQRGGLPRDGLWSAKAGSIYPLPAGAREAGCPDILYQTCSRA